tara:strand:- start:537 stop:1748 length:1212 start_codon:yes stop_codon:yes gene_type:complete
MAMLSIVVMFSGSLYAQSPGGRGNINLTLPAGDGKALIESICYSCHTVFNIVGSAGYNTSEEWQSVFGTMIDLPERQAATIGNYLAEHYPADPSRAPTLVDGDFEIEIIEWQAPTLGQRARDPVEAPDGSIWWTGMYASLIGRLDPQTGAMEEFRLPAAARPHSIIPDQEGNIWYTGNSNSTIGKLDPGTGLITEYPTEARDPHTMTWHPNGDLYFTSQNSNMLGRLDPQTGEMDEIQTEPRPYGIKVGRNGTVYIAYNGTNKIGAMDPETMEVRYFTISEPESRIRRLDLASDGSIWYVNSSMGRIGHLDTNTGVYEEWESPSGPQSHPYAISVIDDVVWYNESGMRPDTLVRFDPAAETFQSWPIPSGVGIVRNSWVTQDGNLLIHQSSTNKIGLVLIPKD